jgi:hypothetical protein
MIFPYTADKACHWIGPGWTHSKYQLVKQQTGGECDKRREVFGEI